MKIYISAKLDKKELIADNRRAIVSFFKNAFQDYNSQLFDKYYGTGNVLQKNFCFSLKLDMPKFDGDHVLLNSEDVELSVYTNSFEDGIDIYNAVTMQKNKKYPFPEGNNFTVKDTKISNHKIITSDEIKVKFYSPLIVRKHEEGKDYYMPFDDPEFEKYFIMSAEKYLESLNIIYDGSLKILPVNPKKTVAVSFGNKITGNIGTYLIKGNPEILNVLYQSGAGSRRSQGFGLFELV